MKRPEWVNVPNLLSLIRLLLVGVFVWFFFTPSLSDIAIWVYLAAGLTDVADGWIARHYHLITSLGKLLDPLADKLMVVTVCICLAVKSYMPVIVPVILGGKELLMILGGLFIYKKRNFVVYSNVFGKMAAAFVFLSIVLCFFHPITAPWDWVLMGIALCLTIAALVQYAYLRLFKKETDEKA